MILSNQKKKILKVSLQFKKANPTFKVEKHLCQENLYNHIFDENKSSTNLHFPIFAQLLKLPRRWAHPRIYKGRMDGDSYYTM